MILTTIAKGTELCPECRLQGLGYDSSIGHAFRMLLNAESFLARRLDMLQRALQGAGAGGPLPYVLIDNSSKCNTNDNSEKVLPNGTVWLPQLMRKVGQWPISLLTVNVPIEGHALLAHNAALCRVHLSSGMSPRSVKSADSMTHARTTCEPLQIAEQATGRRRAFRADAASAAKHANPNRRGKLWIPVILLAQIAFKVLYSGLVSEKHICNRKDQS